MGNRELCEAASKEIEKAKEMGHNILTANIAMTGLSEWHVPVVETVTLDPDPKNGDIYPQGDKLAVTRQGLSKLAVAAGVIWSASETKRTDDRKCRDYLSFQAVGGIQKPDGTYTFMKAEYDLDMEVVEEDLINIHSAAAKKYNKDQSYIDYCVRRDLIQKRKHKMKLCESGAKDRVIRELLGIKATYTLDQIKKPFVIMRITVRPDYSDQDVKKAMLAAAIGSMTGIYGGAPAPPPQIGYEEPIDITPEEEPDTGTEDERPDPKESALIDFKNSNEFDQYRAITDLALSKKYDLQDYLARAQSTLPQLGDERRTALFEHLLSLPDKEANASGPVQNVAF